MSTFIIYALLITAVAVLGMLRPLLRKPVNQSIERREQNILFAKQRLAELDEQLHNDTITEIDYQELRAEIEKNLADDLELSNDDQAQPSDESPKSNKLIIVFISIFLPISGLASYWLIGTPSALQQQAEQVQFDPENIEAMIASVEARLAENPNDIQGWTILSRTYLALGRFAEARSGFLKLIELEGESANVLTSLADATALLAGGNMQGEPTSYIERALAIEPAHPQALWLAGLSAAQGANPERARLYWNKLLPLLEQTPQQQRELREIIQQTFDEELNVPAASNDSEKAEARVDISISLAPDLADKVSADDVVFVFARAKQGPPAPLAVKRLSPADLPTRITLSDSDAMMPQLKLSLFDTVLVSARISKSGDPIASPGDLQSALVETSNSATTAIELTISELVE